LRNLDLLSSVYFLLPFECLDCAVQGKFYTEALPRTVYAPRIPNKPVFVPNNAVYMRGRLCAFYGRSLFIVMPRDGGYRFKPHTIQIKNIVLYGRSYGNLYGFGAAPA